jgi:hypothetical protein
MTKNIVGKIAMGVMVVCLGLGAESLKAGVGKELDKMEHALGWDSLNLKRIEEDKAGRVTLERDSNAVNRMERVTSYHKNGRKAEQTFTVADRSNNKTLFTEKKEWSEHGRLQSDNIEDDVFNGDGKQMKGRIVEQQDEHGRLTSELTKEYSPVTSDWGVASKKTVSYYDGGDMKERITETPPSDEKTRESWGEKKGALGRKESTQTWNSARGSWTEN